MLIANNSSVSTHNINHDYKQTLAKYFPVCPVKKEDKTKSDLKKKDQVWMSDSS